MGRCAKRTKKIVKAIAVNLTPVGVKLIGTVVGLVATTDWTNDEKREAAVAIGKGALTDAGINAKETAIRALVEVSVAALKDGQEALEELGAPDLDDDQEVAALA